MSVEHDNRMLELLDEHRNIRTLKFGIARLERKKTEDELKKRQCSPNGDTVILRERLLRAILKGDNRYEQRVPWYEFDEARQIQNEIRDETNLATVPEIPNIMDSPVPAGRGNTVDDALIREIEYEQMRRSMSAPPIQSTVGPPVTPSVTTSTSLAPMPIMSTSIVSRPYSQGENVSARVNTQQRSSRGYFSTQIRSLQGNLAVERHTLSADGAQANSVPRTKLPRQTPKSRHMISHLERELTIDEDDLETRSETFGSSVDQSRI